MEQDSLRQQVKHLKTNGISYKKIADGIKVNQSSFYSWVRGNYNFSDEVADRLQQWITRELLEHTPTGKKFQTVRNLITLLCEYEFDDDEILKQLPQYDKDVRYYITNKGNVFSLCGKEWIKKKPQIDEKGYFYVDLYSNGERTRKRIHQLVVEAFMPDVDLTGKEIHHIDQNKGNNDIKNLLVLTREQHARIHRYLNKWKDDSSL